MTTKRAWLLVLLGIAVVVGIFAVVIHYANVPVLEPQGIIGLKERNLIYFAFGLSLIVVIPVFVMLFLFAYKYREGNHATYQPNWDHHRGIETIWWLVPTILILILSVVTWNSSHDLDPYRPLASTATPLRVQVIALQWRWLFIYPDLGVASVNHLQIPVGQPVNFEITADAPMNSFWIPQLGGQVYAMAGMVTKLHLQADNVGDYYGTSANISGKGFSDMHFDVRADSSTAFYDWLAAVQQSPRFLTFDSYEQLAKPSRNTDTQLYGATQADLFSLIHSKFMGHSHSMAAMEQPDGSLGT
ncbi:ubiquinol oxidase subunit II [Candidatus Saccharibacteria bacterium]|nr:ubiquinol oxidase subunit II [Candidatus Saccharibacteria bacterium]